MNFIRYPFFLFIIFLSASTETRLLSQDITTFLSQKFPKPDQYKLLKADRFHQQGKALIQQVSGDSLLITDSVHFEQNEVALKKHYTLRIKASYFFKNANGLYFMVLHKHVRKFWANFQGEKHSLNLMIKIENAVYDSLTKADKIRENAEIKMYIDDKIPLVSIAEHMEENALLKLQKVLFVYLSWPHEPDLVWLYSDSQSIPDKNNTAAFAQLNNIPITSDSSSSKIKKNSTPEFDSMHIAEIQSSIFKEFESSRLKNSSPPIPINYQQIYSETVDSVHQLWYKSTSANKFEPLVSDTIGNTIRPLQTTTAFDYTYTIQIAACRTRLEKPELKKLWNGALSIKESFEDGWFKYTIGTFNNYEDAMTILTEAKSSKFFVAVYLKQKRTKIIMPAK